MTDNTKRELLSVSQRKVGADDGYTKCTATTILALRAPKNKTTLEADNLRLGTDERLEFNCGSDLNAVVTIEPAKATGKFTCTALGDVTPSAKVTTALIGNDPQTVPRVDQYLKAAERQLSNHLSRTLRVLMWRRGISVAYNRLVFRGAFWSLDGQQWKPIHCLLQGHLSIEPQERAGPVPPETGRGHAGRKWAG